MKLIKFLFFLICLVFISRDAESSSSRPPFILITIPKSGTHLMFQTIELLTGGTRIWHENPPKKAIPAFPHYLETHFCVSSALEKYYDEHPEILKIILIRDLRDVAVSLVYDISQRKWPYLFGDEYQKFLAMSFDEKLLFVINFEPNKQYYSNVRQIQVKKWAYESFATWCHQALKYTKRSDAEVFRFEDLVGVEGGGSFDMQIIQLKRLAKIFRMNFSDELLARVARNIHGNNCMLYKNNEVGTFELFTHAPSTFRSGKIGGWKDAFQKEHKDAFKKRLGNLLIEFGYERDNNW